MPLTLLWRWRDGTSDSPSKGVKNNSAWRCSYKKYMMARRKLFSNTQAAPVTDGCWYLLHQLCHFHGKVTVLFYLSGSAVVKKRWSFVTATQRPVCRCCGGGARPKDGVVKDAHCGGGVWRNITCTPRMSPISVDDSPGEWPDSPAMALFRW